MAAQLTALQQAASESGQDTLRQAAQAALESLAPAAQDATVTEYEPVEQQLQSTVSALLDLGFATQDAGDRARALTIVVDVWQAARQDGLTTAVYPEALTDEVAHISSYTCGDEGLAAVAADRSGSEQAVQPASYCPCSRVSISSTTSARSTPPAPSRAMRT